MTANRIDDMKAAAAEHVAGSDDRLSDLKDRILELSRPDQAALAAWLAEMLV